MFYSRQILTRKAPLGQTSEEALNPTVPMAPISLSGILMKDVNRLLVEINDAWKTKAAPSDPTRLPENKCQAKLVPCEAVTLPKSRVEYLGEIEQSFPYSNGAIFKGIQRTSYSAMRLDRDTGLNHITQSALNKDHHHVDAANITLWDDYDPYQAYTNAFNHFERFDIEGDGEFIPPGHAYIPSSLIPSPPPPEEPHKSDEIQEQHPDEQVKQQSDKSKDTNQVPKMQSPVRRAKWKAATNDEYNVIPGQIYQTWLRDVVPNRGRKIKMVNKHDQFKISGEHPGLAAKMEEEPFTLLGEILDLKMDEHDLDKRIREMQEKIKKFSEDDNNKRWHFLSEEDLKSLPCIKNHSYGRIVQERRVRQFSDNCPSSLIPSSAAEHGNWMKITQPKKAMDADYEDDVVDNGSESDGSDGDESDSDEERADGLSEGEGDYDLNPYINNKRKRRNEETSSGEESDPDVKEIRTVRVEVLVRGGAVIFDGYVPLTLRTKIYKRKCSYSGLKGCCSEILTFLGIHTILPFPYELPFPHPPPEITNRFDFYNTLDEPFQPTAPVSGAGSPPRPDFLLTEPPITEYVAGYERLNVYHDCDLNTWARLGSRDFHDFCENVTHIRLLLW